VCNNAKKILAAKKKYAVCQYVLASCRNPDPKDWMELWDNAQVVWSYYDLPTPKLYRAPLAADPEIFCTQDVDKKYMVGTNGNAFKAECIGEMHMAAYHAGGRVVHIGPNWDNNPIVDYKQSISDDELREVYNACDWWGALRRRDGFEMTAVEALLCGVRPIMFDQPWFRHWFDGLATFIPELPPDDVVGWVHRIFKKGAKPVTEKEIEETKRRFNWETSVKGFWERCRT
jgi:hypothetical protein